MSRFERVTEYLPTSWLAARYIFNDRDDMVGFLGSMNKDPDLIKALEALAHPSAHSRPHPH